MIGAQAFRITSRRFASTTTATASSINSRRLLLTGATLAIGGTVAYGASTTTDAIQAEAQATAVGNNALDPDTFKSFKLANIEKVNHNVSKFSFKLPKGATELGLPVASCLVIKFAQPNQGGEKPKVVIRPYTPVDSNEKGHFDFVIKKYPNGPASTHIYLMKVGDTLDMKGPIPKYILKPNEFKHIGMIAGGTGLTPMLQIINDLLSKPSSKTKLSLIFANVAEDDIILKDELDKKAKESNGRFEVYYTLDKPKDGWKGGKGFVNEDMIKTYMPKAKDENGIVMVCGPDPMLGHVSGLKAPDRSQGELGGLLNKLGYEKKNVFKF